MTKLLIVVDFQNDFVDGALGFKGAETLDKIIEDKIIKYLKNNDDIIYTLDTHYDNYLDTQEGKKLPIVHCIESTFGHQVYGNVGKYVKDAKKVFKKNTFGSLDLGNYLKDKNYEEIELVGLVSNICVISNAVIAKAALPEALIIVDRQATLSFDALLHEKTFDVLKGLQVLVI